MFCERYFLSNAYDIFYFDKRNNCGQNHKLRHDRNFFEMDESERKKNGGKNLLRKPIKSHLKVAEAYIKGDQVTKHKRVPCHYSQEKSLFH